LTFTFELDPPATLPLAFRLEVMLAFIVAGCARGVSGAVPTDVDDDE
jgi:hypothetical protein